MNEADVLDIVRNAIWTVIVVSAPCVVAAMAAGLVVSVLQALTQIQEVTLTFIPKIMAVFMAAVVSAYFMGARIHSHALMIFSGIERGF